MTAASPDPETIAGFLQHCLFTMFAEDIGLLSEDGFKKLLAQVKSSPQGFPVLISALWKEMATGTGYSTLLFQEIACFNGGLFENTTALLPQRANSCFTADRNSNIGRHQLPNSRLTGFLKTVLLSS
jgi:hypothetical protein